jgi:anti-sigma regulatory factor (Ser/Thr protein kinase)
MEVTEYALLRVGDGTAVGEARRTAGELASSLGLDATDAGRVALVVTEIATNVVKHAGEGELLVRGLRSAEATGVGVVALDRGPGIANVSEALRDGHSTRGTSGTGLGAIARIATRFEIFSEPGRGTAVLAQVWSAETKPASEPMEIGGVSVPYPGEIVSGDAWATRETPGTTLLMVADGLGHGTHAAAASRAAVDAFRLDRGAAPAEALERIHHALRPTRGAAVAVAAVDREKGLVRFAGIGNIAGTIVSGEKTRSVVSHHGTAGGAARRIQEFTYPWNGGDLLVLHSDGLTSRWTLAAYPGLAQRHPALIAGVLYRDHRRGRDDTTVVVLREAA